MTTHILNLIPLAWALQNAGHSVRFAVHPNAVDLVARSGVGAVPVGRPLHVEQLMTKDAVLAGLNFDISEQAPDNDRALGILTWYTTVFLQHAADDSVMDDIVAFARSWQPDLVVWDALTYSGPVAARASGAAHARILFGLDLMARLRQLFLDRQSRLPAGARDDILAEWLGGTLRRHGCAFTETDTVGHWTIDPMPPSMRLPVDLPYVPMRQIPYNGGAAVPQWVHQAPRKPRICLTLGLSGREAWGEGETSLDDVLAAVADLDAELVATLSAEQSRALKRVPDNVRIVDFVPLTALLPTCSGVVHHGGVGTLHTAIASRVPQLIVPDRVWDPALIAQSIAGMGAGIAVSPEKLTPTLLNQELRRLLDDPSFQDNTDRLYQDTLAAPGPDALARVLRDLTERHHDR